MIYPRVLEQLKKEGKDESLASKITGMLIDAQVFELSDIVDFLEDPSEFKDRIYEALDLI